MKRGFLTLLAAALVSGSAWASGYQVLLQSNRSTAMGNIGVGLRPDPSSIHFNPGSLAMMRENGVQIGANLIYSKIAFLPENSGTTYFTENPTGTPFHLFAAFGPADGKIKFGLGVYTPYGSSVEWEDNWAGRFNLTSLSLRAIYIQPTVSYRINDELSVGGGIIYSTGGVNLQRDLPIYMHDDQYASAELDGKASGWGFNIGAFYKPSEKFSIGLNYRSRINMKVDEGKATFTRPELAAGQVPAEANFTSELPLPSNLSLGLAYYPTDKITVGFDVTRTGWGAYEALTFAYDKEVAGSKETKAIRNYEDTYAFRLGGEYKLAEIFRIRAGAYYDQAPVQDGYLTAETPDANTLGLTAGFGLNLGEKFVVDASFLYINKAERYNDATIDPAASTISGTYKSLAYIPGVSFTYKF